MYCNSKVIWNFFAFIYIGLYISKFVFPCVFGFSFFELFPFLATLEKKNKNCGYVFQADCTLSLISLSSSPCPLKRGKVFVVFWRNKELLREVGRRDFELGSDPVFPVERVEIVLEEWYITFKQHGFELRHTEFPKFYTSSALLFTA